MATPIRNIDQGNVTFRDNTKESIEEVEEEVPQPKQESIFVVKPKNIKFNKQFDPE